MLMSKAKGLMFCLAALLCGGLMLQALADDEAPAESVLDKPAPESVEDLQAIEERVTALVEKASACTVGLRIVSADHTAAV
jgi:hypothetical protein